jgi:hypothetical protein
MFHRGGYGRGQGRGSGLRGGRAGLTGHVGKRWRLPARGAGMAWAAGTAWPGTRYATASIGKFLHKLIRINSDDPGHAAHRQP